MYVSKYYYVQICTEAICTFKYTLVYTDQWNHTLFIPSCNILMFEYHCNLLPNTVCEILVANVKKSVILVTLVYTGTYSYIHLSLTCTLYPESGLICLRLATKICLPDCSKLGQFLIHWVLSICSLFQRQG